MGLEDETLPSRSHHSTISLFLSFFYSHLSPFLDAKKV